jgi:3-phosphoshikimate 1-carboxyvinyltransferase
MTFLLLNLTLIMIKNFFQFSIVSGKYSAVKLIAEKSRLKGTIAIPGSKSHTIRALAIASLAAGKSLIRKPLVSSDTLSAVSCYKSLGAKIDTSNPDCWQVEGNAGKISVPQQIIDVGNSGTTLRIAAGSSTLAEAGKPIRLTGDEQIQSRPIGPLLEALNKLGAKCRSIKNNGKAPIEIEGKIKGGKTTIEAFTSQYLTSLLLCTPLAEQDSEIIVSLLNEPGYVQMTLDWLNRQKIKYENDGLKKFVIKGGQNYQAFDEVIPADFSSATFFLCAAALVGDDVTLTGLDFKDSQPDKAVVDYLKQMCAKITVDKNAINVRASKLKGVVIDMNKTPDALPAMAVTAAFAEGQSRFINVPQARSKETDRIKCMAEELRKMNINAEELPDGLIINPGRPKANSFDGRGDHRIVMAMAVAALAMEGQSTIETAEAMNVTFPDFVSLMNKLGAKMQIR